MQQLPRIEQTFRSVVKRGKLALLSLALMLSSQAPTVAADSPVTAAVVALEYMGGRILCSGVIITDQHVLTAAHCVCGELPVYAFLGNTAFRRTANAGYSIRLNVNLNRVSFMVADFCNRYTSDRIAAMARGDLALIFLEDGLPPELQNMVLSEAALSNGNVRMEEVFVVGWGETDNFWRSGTKNFVPVKVTSRLCSPADEAAHGCAAGQEALAIDPPRDTCFADSGGGLYARDATGELYLMAITSRAARATPHNLCGMGGIYTSLESVNVRSWLADELTRTYRHSHE